MKYTPENTVKAGKNIDVFLDGKFMRYAIEADDEDGYVVSAVVDTAGNIMHKNGEIEYAKHFGKVVVSKRRHGNTSD